MQTLETQKVAGIWALADKNTNALLTDYNGQIIVFPSREDAREYARNDGYESRPVYSKVNFKNRN